MVHPANQQELPKYRLERWSGTRFSVYLSQNGPMILPGRQELLTARLDILVKEALELYVRENRAPPSTIIMYRDGVGDSQFEAAVQSEYSMMIKGIRDYTPQTAYRPQTTNIMVNKRINHRFFTPDGQNVQPGTVIDTVVTSPLFYDFFLVAQAVDHFTTALPTRFVVLQSDLSGPTTSCKTSHPNSAISTATTLALSVFRCLFKLPTNSASARTLPLAGLALFVIIARHTQSLIALAMLAGIVQVLDGIIGIYQQDVLKSIGPFFLAVAQSPHKSHMASTLTSLDNVLKFTERIGVKLSLSQLNSSLQQVLIKIVEGTEKYYADIDAQKSALEQQVKSLKEENATLHSSGGQTYAVTSEENEDAEELLHSAKAISKLEKEVRNQMRINANLQKQVTLLKERLKQIKSGSTGEGYTIHENVAVFKDTSSVPSIANIAQAEFGDEYESMVLAPELDFPVVPKIAALLNRFEERKYTHQYPLHQFADLFIQLAEEVRSLVAMECKVLELKSPIYIFGDIHGNYKDLRFYLSRFNPTGRMGWLPHRLLFLGDYVDRGDHSIEVVARLFIDKICSRNKVYLLRGNHELSYVNSQVETYGSGCFKLQCQNHFKTRGDEVFWAINRAFDCLPLAAVVDHELFCVHGGIPRLDLPPIPTPPPPNPPIRPPITFSLDKQKSLARTASTMNLNFSVFGEKQQSLLSSLATSATSQSTASQIMGRGGAQNLQMSTATLDASPSTLDLIKSTSLSPENFFHSSKDTRIESIRNFPPSIPGSLAYHEACPLLSDLLWADPAPPNRPLDANGFCVGVRGPDSVMFGQKAVDNFLQNAGLTLIIRGHEDQTDGAQLACNQKVFTVFSSSNYRNSNSGACLLCTDKKIHVAIKQCNLPRSMTSSQSGTRIPHLFSEQDSLELNTDKGGVVIGEQKVKGQDQIKFEMKGAMEGRPQSMVLGGPLYAATGKKPTPLMVTASEAPAQKSASPSSPTTKKRSFSKPESASKRAEGTPTRVNSGAAKKVVTKKSEK
ncbi:putative Serine/threonine-protein phosphatase [Blattamonas nauphoetae]|uniref:Serine/threonine-protein phosphatase n=1 Tax=Blattamonas nauphoetae TaxID=2049346 RepID=A0ABQ9YB89_9EUKA|nr:putative Serine/threonine-protein phosphatase [Blattamonas nauphoetae]